MHSATVTTTSTSLLLPVTTYRGTLNPVGRSSQLTWEKLVPYLSHHEERSTKEGKLWSPVLLMPCHRKNENVVQIGALVGDVDDYSDPDEVLLILESAGLTYLAHTSFSHHPERPKYRIILPFSRLVNPEEHAAVLRGFCALYGGNHLDPVCKDRSRAFYTPSVPRKRDWEPWVRQHSGMPLDPDAMIAAAPPLVVREYRAPPEFPTNGHRPAAQIVLERSLLRTMNDARHYRGYHLACQLRDNRYSESEAEPVVLELQRLLENDSDHPYTEREVLASLAYAYRQPARDPWPDKPRLSGTSDSTHTDEDEESMEDLPSVPVHKSDVGNAIRLVQHSGDNLRYAFGRGWLCWDGRRWHIDQRDAIQNHAKETARAILIEAITCEDPNERKKLAAWAITSETAGRIHAMLDMAKSDPLIRCDTLDLDADPFLFNCMNGTIDLQTGELREHRRKDMITNLSPVEYDPDATLPEWDDFLCSVTNDDPDLIDFMQRAVGHSLSGDTSEDAIFFALGPTRTGKSTFLNAISSALGSYGESADFETFLVRDRIGSPRPDLARLCGKRFVSSVETERGRRFANGLLKNLSGDDFLTCRFLFKQEFSFRPQFKVWLAANDAPEAPHDDDAFWVRLKRLPFIHVPATIDKDLKARLRDPVHAGPAILAWAVKGFQRWQAVGLQAPEAVRAATDEYRSAMDPLAGLFPHYLVLAPGKIASLDQIKDAYWRYVHDNDVADPLSTHNLTRMLKDRGCRLIHTEKGNRWRGIGIVEKNLFGSS